MSKGTLYIFVEKIAFPYQNRKACLASFCKENASGNNIMTRRPIPFINWWNIMTFIITATDYVMATAVATECDKHMYFPWMIWFRGK